ncbi:fimbrial protein [Serratia marcescens]
MFFFYASCSMSNSTLHGWGVVNMQGAIIDTACAIAVKSRDQTIDMEVASLANIILDGRGGEKAFAIELENCTLERANKPGGKQFQVTFDGDAEGELFGVRGDVSGVALQISDTSGNIAVPGAPLPLTGITPGNMRLDYRLRLVTNNQVLKAGEYFSVVRFKLDYF